MKIILLLFKIIAKNANPEELEVLTNESRNKKLSAMKTLTTNLFFSSSMSDAPSHEDTEDYQNYCAFLTQRRTA